MGPTWVLSAPDGSHGPMNLAIGVALLWLEIDLPPLGYRRLWLDALVPAVSLRWRWLIDSIIGIITTPKLITATILCISNIPKKLQCPRWHPGEALQKQPIPQWRKMRQQGYQASKTRLIKISRKAWNKLYRCHYRWSVLYKFSKLHATSISIEWRPSIRPESYKVKYITQNNKE